MAIVANETPASHAVTIRRRPAAGMPDGQPSLLPAALARASPSFGIVITSYAPALAAPALAVVGVGFCLTTWAIPDMTKKTQTGGFVFLGWGGFGATAVASWDEFGGDAIYLAWSAFAMSGLIIAMPIVFTWVAYGTCKRQAQTQKRAEDERMNFRADVAKLLDIRS